MVDITCHLKSARLRDEQAPIAAGQHLAAYYRVPKHPHIIQVVAYRSGNAGFVKDTCLKPVPSRTAIG